MAFISTLNDIKVGLVVNYEGEPYIVLEANFVRMQQRKPVMQTKMRHLITGKVLEYSFKPGDKLEIADLVRTKVNYLYRDGDSLHFMDNRTYEQFSLPVSLLGEKVGFLKDGQEVDVLFYNDKPINIELPKKVELRVTAAPPGVKGDTAQGSVLKTVTLETGATIQAPLFVKDGDVIRINTERAEYVERV
jgi:elongation factor P